MKTDDKNIIIGKKYSDLLAGIICLTFSIVGLTIMDKSQIMTWVIIGFFGIGSIVLLLKFVNLNNRFISENSKEAKLIREKEFKHLYSTNGLFNYNEIGFELMLNGKLTKTKWNEINRILAYKVDLLAVDEICLFVDIDKERSFEISESTKGWFVFGEKIREIFPEIKETWEFDIAIPPFERNETELYNRNKNAV
ncbi:hypothetical protein [Mariniflexile sp.]|uniref:hypothetical protein n=1 Tax=Mariniflexile sp. TaxID=1979402 RepID=UPI0040476A99